MYMVRILRVVALALLSNALSQSAHAMLIPIDFDGAFVDTLSVNTYSEAGFSVSANSNDTGAGAGTLIDSVMRPGDTFFFQKDDGGLFTFDSFTVANNNFEGPDAFKLLGFFNGSEVVDFGEFVLPATTGQSFSGFSQTAINELRIIGTQIRDATPIWDQFVFNTHTVPSPGTMALFGLGLVGLGWSRRGTA